MSTALAPELRPRVAAAPVAHLASVRPDGAPHVVVLTFALDGDRLVSVVDHKPKTTNSLQRLRNLRTNPGVSLLVDHYEDDWTQLWWARADGTARITEDGPEHAEAVDLLAAKYAPYRETRPEGPAIIVTVDRWTSWQATPA